MALRDHPLLQKSLTKQEQLHFAQQLLALLHAGLPLLNAIELLYQSAPKPWLGWLMRIHSLLKKGYSLSHCLREQGGQFSMEFINLIRVSERSGDLSLALKTISLFGNDFKAEGALHEYYNPDTGAPIMNKGFQNWNFLVLNMIDQVSGKTTIEEF